MANVGLDETKRLEKLEAENLASFALKSAERRDEPGIQFRKHPEKTPLEFRTEYHRDRDRIIWSRTFRRLQHKTQVFPHYSQDHYRRRLTHTIEVAQIATTLARALHLNEVVTEAIALGHDLGHTPFGHAGERALNKIHLNLNFCKYSEDQSHLPIPVIGFNHCVHGIEVVSRIERDYHLNGNDYYGLNLTQDVRDGILQHMRDEKRGSLDYQLGISDISQFDEFKEFTTNKGSLEAQCVYFADKVAYLLGDIEDGIRRQLFDPSKLNSDPFIKHIRQSLAKRRKGNGNKKPQLRNVDDYLHFRRAALAELILNCIERAKTKSKCANFQTVNDVLKYNERVVWVDDNTHAKWTQFNKKWMKGKLYCNEHVMACEVKARKIVTDLFNAYLNTFNLIGSEYRKDARKTYTQIGIEDKEMITWLTVRNYVAGMTDAFAINQHARLFTAREQVSFV